MKKTLVILSLIIVVLAVVFTACGTKGEDETTTLPNADNTASTVEYSTEENGELFVTNKDGDHIPVTTNKSGMLDQYEDLVTKTVEQVSKEQVEMNNSTQPTSSAQNSTTTAQNTTSANTNPGTVVIGGDNLSGNGSHDAVIDWRK